MVLRGRKKSKILSLDSKILVNVNIGCGNNPEKEINLEQKKIDVLAGLSTQPDLMMDLSIGRQKATLYEDISMNIGCPVGLVPVYRAYNGKTIDRQILLEEMETAAMNGIAWFVLHLFPMHEHIEILSRTRNGISSRGGGILIRDLETNGKAKNAYWDIFDDIIWIVKRYGIVISLGSAFRGGIADECLDKLHVAELKANLGFRDLLRSEGIEVFMEGMGHSRFNMLNEAKDLINTCGLPCMPLGPMYADKFDRDDHIVNAISFFYSVSRGLNYRIINSITPSEHSGGIPSLDDVLIGYNTARSTARLCNRFLEFDDETGTNFCIDSTEIGLICERCGNACPRLSRFIDIK